MLAECWPAGYEVMDRPETVYFKKNYPFSLFTIFSFHKTRFLTSVTLFFFFNFTLYFHPIQTYRLFLVVLLRPVSQSQAESERLPAGPAGCGWTGPVGQELVSLERPVMMLRLWLGQTTLTQHIKFKTHLDLNEWVYMVVRPRSVPRRIVTRF